jgi:hypothetical protein
MHGIKMLVRLIGEGWLTYCLTVIETMWVVISLTLAIFVREIAIAFAIIICVTAGYNIKKRYIDRKKEEDEQSLYSEMNNDGNNHPTTQYSTAEVVVSETTAVIGSGEVKATKESVTVAAEV